MDGKKWVARWPGSGTTFSLTAGQTYGVKCILDWPGSVRRLRFYVDRNQDGDFADPGEQVLLSPSLGYSWDGGSVGLYRGSGDTTSTIQWDNFICGYDADSDGDIGTVSSPDPGDYIYAAYGFDGDWHEIDFTHDDNGNLTGDGLLKYTYDAWNRLVGVWYNNGDVSESNEQLARYEYDGLPALDATQEGQGFRRIEKEVTANQGEGVVHHSDDGDMTGILAGERHEHYYWGGLRGGAGVSPANWRLIETTNHVESAGSYSYDDSDVLNQFVYGTQYIDEPVRYDRNTDVGTDDDCVDGDGSEAYFYHQDANWRVVMLTDQDGHVVERVEYTAYGEPTLYGGYDSTAGAEMANALLVSTVGNPFLHQGLFRDRETLTYQNRFRQYHSRSGRFMQRDPIGLAGGLNVYLYCDGDPLFCIDPSGYFTFYDPTRTWAEAFLEYTGGRGYVPVIDYGRPHTIVVVVAEIVSVCAPAGAVGRTITLTPKALALARKGWAGKYLVRIRGYIRYDRVSHHGKPRGHWHWFGD